MADSTDPAFGPVSVSVHGEVGELQLDRPDVLNAFDDDLIRGIHDAAQWFDSATAVKVVVVSGAGRSFCSGFDTTQFAQTTDTTSVRAIVDAGRRMAHAVARMRAMTVAAVHGHCVGGGVVLMAACDFRVAARSALFSLPETDIGIPLAWGGVPALVREAGALFAADFILTGRRVTADEALRHGLIAEVVDDDRLEARGAELAHSLTRHSPMVLETTKQQLIAARSALLSDAYSFTDAHVLFSALGDEASQRQRAQYLDRRKRRTG